MNASDVILDPAETARRRNDPCFLTPDGGMSYGEVLAAVNRAANAFRALGIRPDDRILFILRDTPEMVAAYLGAIKAGAVAIAVNNKLPAADVTFIAQHSNARAVLADTAFASIIAGIGPDPLVLWCGGRGDGSGRDWHSFAAAQKDEAAAEPRRPEDMAFWVYTSGTTGRPKGVVHTHGNVESCRFLLRDHLGCGKDDIVFPTSKLFFAYPMANAVMGPLALGLRVVLYPDWPDPAAIVDMVRQYRPTVMFSVPTIYRRLLQETEDAVRQMASLRFCVSGGERMPEALGRRWAALTGHGIIEAYGTSETHAVVLASRPDDRIAGCAGLPTPGTEAYLGDAEGNAVPAGEIGVLWLRHPCLARGYWDLAEATADAFREGWFRSGDMFSRDDEGRYWHQGRADDMLKVAGQWVSPAEVENVVFAAGLCREAACVPVPDSDGFHRLALFAVADGSGSDLEQRINTACEVLPRHKRPRWIRLVDEIPKTATGKVQRFRLRQLFEEQ